MVLRDTGQCWFMVGLDLKGFFQPQQFCDSADKHWARPGCLVWKAQVWLFLFWASNPTFLSLRMVNAQHSFSVTHEIPSPLLFASLYVIVSLFISSFFTNLPRDQAHTSYVWQLQLSADTKDD